MKHQNNQTSAATPSRRTFLKLGAVAGSALFLPKGIRAQSKSMLVGSSASLSAAIPESSIPKFVTPLLIPPDMPAVAPNTFDISVRQGYQQILPAAAGFPRTLVARYGPTNNPALDSFPALTIRAQVGTPTTVTWRNGLMNPDGTFQPHVLAAYLDPEYEWANPAGPIDSHGRGNKGSYLGPVPIVTHLHGGHIDPFADGHPLAWYLPDAINTPPGYYRGGTKFDAFQAASGLSWPAGAAIFQYRNSGQPAATLWYHDHTMGITELSVYAGMAGFYLLSGGPYDLPAGLLPSGPFEVPMALQDRAFNPDGSLLFAGGDGNVMLTNGRSWPYLEVEPRRYRFRILNGCNNRILDLSFTSNITAYQIGAEAGFLPAPVRLGDENILGNAERMDVIVDFSKVAIGGVAYLQDSGHDVVQFRVVKPLSSRDTTLPASSLPLSSYSEPRPTVYTNVRKVSVVHDRVGIVRPGLTPLLVPLEFMDPATETPALGSRELWEFYADDEHPMHLHLAHFFVLNRQSFDRRTGALIGSPKNPSGRERGPKDTVMVRSGQITRIIMGGGGFDIAGEYVHHCHILEHEDEGMMRPLVIS
jgi:spore coat protein A, manganese oxidase